MAWLTPAAAYERARRERDRRIIAQVATDARAMDRELRHFDSPGRPDVGRRAVRVTNA